MSLLTFAQGLLDCSLVTLTEAGFPPCKSFLAASPEPALDDCCTCGNNKDGQLWVSIIDSAPRDPFRGQPCGRDFQVTYRVGLSRCTHTLRDDGTVPTAAQLQADAEKMYRDHDLLLKAVTCCWADETFDLDPTQWALGNWSTSPNQGGCQVQTLDVLLRTADCSDCS